MIWPRTLYARIAMALVAVMAISALVYILLSLSAARHYLAELNQSVNRNLAVTLVNDRNLVEEGRLNEDAVKRLFHEYMNINPSIEIYLLDLDGTILSFSADPGKVKRKRVSLDPIEKFFAGQSFPLVGDDPRSHDGRKVFSVTAVPSHEEPAGYLYVVLRGEHYESMQRVFEESLLMRLSSWALVGSLVFGLVIGLVAFHWITRRLRTLSVRMAQFRTAGYVDDLTTQRGGNVNEGDEVDALARTFDRMERRIVEQIEALKRQDALRRDMVARVSHDLRTPIASILGYLETLDAQHEQLDAPTRARHLRVALNQSQRLSRRVAALFELSKLEARDEQPNIEPFALADLGQDVLQKFAIRAKTLEVTLSARVERDLPLVAGDLGLIERVLENLIDNALSHVPKGGKVNLVIRQHDSKVLVAVRDNGPGIPNGELAKIFAPFYSGAPRGRSEDHAGLGLAIARHIVELHHGRLEIQSREGQGAQFSFALPLADTRESSPSRVEPAGPIHQNMNPSEKHSQ